MRCVIESRANQVVHRRVHDHEALAAVFFYVQDARQQHARGADQAAPWLKQKPASRRPDDAREFTRVGSWLKRRFIRVANAQAAADVDVVEMNASDAEFADVRSEPR